MNEESIRTAIQTGNPFGSYPDFYSLENQIRFAYNDALKLRGQGSQDPASEERCIRIIAKTLYEDYPTMIDNELPILMQAGVSGEFGRDCWVSGAMVLQWIRLYSRHQMRLNVIDAQHEERKQSRLTKEEKEQRNEKAYKDSYEKGLHCYRQNGTIFHKEGFAMAQWPAMLYDEYRRRGVRGEPTEDNRKYAAKKAEVHNLEHPLKFQLSAESMKIHRQDIIKAYLLEAHYSDQLPI